VNWRRRVEAAAGERRASGEKGGGGGEERRGTGLLPDLAERSIIKLAYLGALHVTCSILLRC
jgi:hypothetical protein